MKVAKKACGLCGKSKKLRKTGCCGQWICDDEDNYVLFSYARNSCSRNHRRFTLCGYHATEGHGGRWQGCTKCRKEFEPEMVAWYGTNEYNFEKLENPPAYKPKQCAKCDKKISLAKDGHSMKGTQYFCESCTWETPRLERAGASCSNHMRPAYREYTRSRGKGNT